jgi:hypothetical protein
MSDKMIEKQYLNQSIIGHRMEYDQWVRIPDKE